MNILFIQWQNIQQLPNGASVYEHNMAVWLKSLGHQVKVTGHYDKDLCIDRVDYYPYKYRKQLIQWADMVIARVGDARGLGKHTVWIQHNQQKEPFNLTEGRVIYCAEHVSRMAYNCKGSIVKWPWNRYADSKPLPANPKGAVTLINCNANKGGQFLRRLAEALPKVQFLGVKGGYGTQITHSLPNIRYIQGGLDVRTILQQTSVLIMPSEKEGLPTLALEALSLGVPVLMNNIDAAHEMTVPLASFDTFADRLGRMLRKYTIERKAALRLAALHKHIHEEQLKALAEWL